MNKSQMKSNYYAMIASNATVEEFINYEVEFYETFGEVYNKDDLSELDNLKAEEVILLHILDREF